MLTGSNCPVDLVEHRLSARRLPERAKPTHSRIRRHWSHRPSNALRSRQEWFPASVACEVMGSTSLPRRRNSTRDGRARRSPSMPTPTTTAPKSCFIHCRRSNSCTLSSTRRSTSPQSTFVFRDSPGPAPAVAVDDLAQRNAFDQVEVQCLRQIACVVVRVRDRDRRRKGAALLDPAAGRVEELEWIRDDRGVARADPDDLRCHRLRRALDHVEVHAYRTLLIGARERLRGGHGVHFGTPHLRPLGVGRPVEFGLTHPYPAPLDAVGMTAPAKVEPRGLRGDRHVGLTADPLVQRDLVRADRAAEPVAQLVAVPARLVVCRTTSRRVRRLPRNPAGKMHSTPAIAPSTASRSGAMYSASHSTVTPPTEIGWVAKLTTAASGRPSARSIRKTVKASSTARIRSTRLPETSSTRRSPRRSVRPPAATTLHTRHRSAGRRARRQPAAECRDVRKPAADGRTADVARRAPVVARVHRDRGRGDARQLCDALIHELGTLAKTRSVATIAAVRSPSESTSACATGGSCAPCLKAPCAAQQPTGSPSGGVMSTRDSRRQAHSRSSVLTSRPITASLSPCVAVAILGSSRRFPDLDAVTTVGSRSGRS